MLNQLLTLWEKQADFTDLAQEIIEKDLLSATVTGLSGSGRSFFLAALAKKVGGKTLVLTSSQARAEKLYLELETYLSGFVNLLPSREFFISPETISRSEEIQRQRMLFLQWLSENEPGLYVAPAAAVISPMLPREVWSGFAVNLRKGMRINRQELIDNLVNLGYTRTTLTETFGYFSARGDIVDIFPPGHEYPIRIELFDDEIESLRRFDSQSQRTIEQVDTTFIMPAFELILDPARYEEGRKVIEAKLERALSNLRKRGDKDLAVKLNQRILRQLERLAEPEGLDIMPYYYNIFYGSSETLLHYLPEESLVVLDEPEDIFSEEDNLRQEVDDYHTGLLLEGELLETGIPPMCSVETLLTELKKPLIKLDYLAISGESLNKEKVYKADSSGVPFYHGQWPLFHKEYLSWREKGYSIFLSGGSFEQSRKFISMVEEQLGRPGELSAIEHLAVEFEEGFILPSLKIVLITPANLVAGRKKKKRHLRKEGIRLSDYRELNPGDYIVHEQHGIGRYQGLHTLEVGGVKRDYLMLQYRGTDKIYLPIDQIGMIQKYSGGEGPAPRLHNLGGAEWQRLKKRVSQSVEVLARELLALYAARQSIEGYRFGPDHPWQQEFEASFPYEETPDQLQAISEVKADLEKGHPMDRLICGDVGYGKTEVAMRAAFKVVMEGKQVAILVPTTVLARQHYQTFSERFSGFPVTIAQVSRLVSQAEQKKSLKDLAEGKVDVVIGTHRLLSKDVSFNDLGLLVVDEEQRFGVRQKEKMKQLRLEVDTLAMTATPIPRTLHLSLAGARDLSIIDTPPEDRFPVQTYVTEYSENLVKEAVQRELNRQGQVFIVYNRVEKINSFAEKIEKLFPGVEIAVGHGQMPPRELEKVMSEFQSGLAKVLISSTIIESGLDIPNVNTLIVYDADRFGLAQLYQIRGRVGRSSRVAYAYLTYRKNKLISETARKRLKAIREFTQLGSGFKIALRDLEIRGAGNILGAEQHGFIAEVGYDLYVKLLDQAVAELKQDKREEEINPRLELSANAYIPSSYINAQDQKVDFYQRIFNASTSADLVEIEDELLDRYASPPEPVRVLLEVARVRIKAKALKIENIRQKDGNLTLQFHRTVKEYPRALDKSINLKQVRLKLLPKRPLVVELKSGDKKWPDLETLSALLDNLHGVAPAGVEK